MFLTLTEIFFNVITPVFGIVLIGYLVAPRLQLEARTLSRLAYYVLIPCFAFNVISTTEIDVAIASRMMAFIILAEIAVALLAFFVGRALGKSPTMISAYILIAVFGNVGNFGLPLIEFRLGPQAITAATIYFLAIVVISFTIGVTAASWQRGGTLGAISAVLKTPAIIALIPAILVNAAGWAPPLAVTRITTLLGSAMVPIMLAALGVQLASTKTITFSKDVWIATGLRLIGGPALALLIVIPFGLTGIERGAGIFQAGMPAAVLTSIIAIEYDLLPEFVTTTVLFSTLASIFTLTLLLAIV